MKTCFKWLGIIIGVLISLPIVIGLSTKLLTSDVPPPGKRYDVGGFKLHLDCQGQANDLPTVIIEGGAGSAVTNYYWLQQQLKKRVQVCRYDRAGLGWSDDIITSRDADTMVTELHTLLTTAQVKPPYLLAGHSMGGPIIRVFAQEYPTEVSALVFIDSSHPEQVERLNLPDDMMGTMQTVGSILGDLGLLPYFVGSFALGLPEEQANAMNWMARNGRMIRQSAIEMEKMEVIFDRAKNTTDFGDLPVRVFSAGVQSTGMESMLPEGFDPELMFKNFQILQQELTEISTNSQQVIVEGADHGSINTVEDYSSVVAKGIHELLDEMEQAQI